MAQDRDRTDRFLPLKPFVLDVLLELADGKRHGWSVIRDIQQREGGDRILPANFYRTLRALRDDGLIAEAAGDADEDPKRAPPILQPHVARRQGGARRGEAPRSAGCRSAGAKVVESPLTMPASQTFYRVLLRMCPPDLRAEFGAEMEALFLADLARARGAGKVRVWARAAVDVLRHGLGARNDSWTRFSRTSAYVDYETGRFWMDTWRYDLRHALRMMLRQRGTTAIILLTLALAIGANTAVFSAVHTVLIRPLPYQQPESLVMMWEKREAEGVMKNSVSAADYLDWARLATSFTAMAAFTEMTADLTGEGDPEKLPVARRVAAVLRGVRYSPAAWAHVRNR